MGQSHEESHEFVHDDVAPEEFLGDLGDVDVVLAHDFLVRVYGQGSCVLVVVVFRVAHYF